MVDQNWRPDASSKWDMIVSGEWIQKAVWNRWVTTRERDQPHKTPVTSTWTSDFLTREGEGLKVVGDWLRDKTISWKTRGVFSRRMQVFSHPRIACKSGVISRKTMLPVRNCKCLVLFKELLELTRRPLEGLILT
jgi:hypothetical protein